MQRESEITELLNEVLTAELTSVNQYFVDSKMLDNWGYDVLAKHYREESIDEMKDADSLIGRILFLEGVPNLQRLGTVRVGESVPEKLQLALDLEYESIERLNRGINQVLRAGRQRARASSSSTSSRARKRTPTGWRPNSAWSRSWARRTTSRNSSAS